MMMKAELVMPWKSWSNKKQTQIRNNEENVWANKKGKKCVEEGRRYERSWNVCTMPWKKIERIIFRLKTLFESGWMISVFLCLYADFSSLISWTDIHVECFERKFSSLFEVFFLLSLLHEAWFDYIILTVIKVRRVFLSSSFLHLVNVSQTMPRRSTEIFRVLSSAFAYLIPFSCSSFEENFFMIISNPPYHVFFKSINIHKRIHIRTVWESFSLRLSPSGSTSIRMSDGSFATFFA